jgi:hypothetical protein
MATWWQLTIPTVAGGLVGIGGAVLGAWLQGVNNRRLFASQAAEAATARRDQARQESLIHAFDQRRDAYAAFLSAANEYHRQLNGLRLGQGMTGEGRPTTIVGISRPPAMAKCLEQAEARRDVILLLAPDEVVAAAADVLHLMWSNPGDIQSHEFGWAVKTFMQSARTDLGVLAATPAGTVSRPNT